MAELFKTTVSNINMHLKNIFDESELNEEVTIRDFLIVQKEDKYEVKRNNNILKSSQSINQVNQG